EQQGRLTETKALLREAAATEHGRVQTMNTLAWRLATGPFPDGPLAVVFAEKAVAGTHRKDPNLLDTLAAAYAEAGQFTNAVGVQQEAMALQENSQERQIYASKLRLYQSKAPYRDQA